ncbi:MAG: threonine synthase [Polyangiaceae bacterium]
MNQMRAHLRCMNGCHGEYPLWEAVFRCPTCGALLDVEHDLTPLRDRSPDQWRALFRERRAEGRFPYDSGVWTRREWVAPSIPDEHVVSMGEGASPLVQARRFGAQIGADDLWIKQCGQSPTGSFKDLGMTVLVSTVLDAVRSGKLKVRAVACASTGDTSAALAAYGAACGLPVVVLLPRGKISTAQLVQPIASGAAVLSLDTDFDGCMAIVQRLAARGLVYLANSMNALRLEGQKTVAFEVTEQLGGEPPQWIVIPSGNLGNAYALYRGFAMMKALGVIDEMPRIVAAQAENADPLYRAWSAGKREIEPLKASPTIASAIQIGNPVSAARAVRALDATRGVVEHVSEQEIADTAARADRTGLYVCPHTAVALSAVEKLLAKHVIRPDERVVVVSTASGLKFTDVLVRYHEHALSGIESRFVNPPAELPAEESAVIRAIESLPT